MARQTRGRRSDYEWLGVCGTVTALDLAVNAVQIGTTGFVSEVSQTLIRVRGRVFGQLDIAGVDERVMVAVGLIVVSSEAFAAGAGSVPSPGSDSEAPWLWHDHLSMSSGAEAAVVTDAYFDRIQIDNKAMRRLKPNENIAFMAEVCATADMGGSLDLMYGLRVLVAR